MDVIGGGTPSKRNPAFYGGEIPWATVRDMNVERLCTTEHSITPAALKASSSKLIPAGEVVIATRVGLGKACILQQDTAINQDLRGLLPKPTKEIDRRFLLHWYKSIAKQVIAAGTGATVQGVKLPFIKGLPFPLPSIEEQQRIVAILDEAFEGLDRARAHAEANLNNARELLARCVESVFVKYTSSRSHQRRLGDIVCRLTNGYVGPTRGIYQEQGVPYLLARHVKDSKLKFDGKTYISREFNEKLKKSKLKKGDVVVVQSGHIGHCAEIPDEHAGHNCHAMIVLTPIETILSGTYLSAVLNTPQMQDAFQAIRTGSTVPHLTCKMVKELSVPVPELAMQDTLVAGISTVRRHVDLVASRYESKLEDLNDLRQSLLQKAFAGELT